LKIFVGTIIVLALASTGFEINQVFAEESFGYMMAEDISSHLTFKFRDGVETHEFPVFKTTNFVANQGTAFQVQGVIKEAPHLHKALDEAYKFRLDKGTNFNYRYFDIDVDFTYASGAFDVHHLVYSDSGGDDSQIPDNVKPRATLQYQNCEIIDYQVESLFNTYRSYGDAETGFAIVETITFQCGGVQSKYHEENDLMHRTEPDVINEFPKLDYNYADNIRTFVTFEFDNGIEKIEFPIFHLLSGFAEDDDPSFRVEGVVNRYPLLSDAIDNARDSRHLSVGPNTDFNVKVEFVKESILSEKIVRVINYEDCRVSGSNISTYYDLEEGYVGIGGFGMMFMTDFVCAGMEPQNPSYEKSMKTNEHYRNYNMASGPTAVAEFRFQDNSVETINFPIFRQQDFLSRSNAAFQLEGMVGEYPLLYKQVDEDARINQISGPTQTHNLFDVDVNLQYDDQPVRGFSYKDCRVTNYLINTEQQNEEGFWVGFAQSNTFEFECLGYSPNNHDEGIILNTSINDKQSSWAGITFDGYLQAEDVSTNLTFTFRDGIETHEFPVFKTTADFAENRGTSFQVQGVIADTPHLHKALDEAYKYRLTGGLLEHNYKFFDVEASAITADSTRKIFFYHDCQIADYLIDTLSHTHRGYLSNNTGFAIVETIDFKCAGLQSETTVHDDLVYQTELGTIRELPKLEYGFADDIHTFVTFEFDYGTERMEIPIFKTTSGFGEDDNPSFHAEGIVNWYPLLASAVDNARDNRDLSIGTNLDFNAKVEFIQESSESEKLVRGIFYEDCRIVGSDIITYWDKEEPYATVGGFAVNHSFDFDCAGMEPMNPSYDKDLRKNQIVRDYLMASDTKAIAEFRFIDNTITIIDFPRFEHQGVIGKSAPQFLLGGMVGEYPLLYNQVDEDANTNQITGVSLINKLFDVDVNIVSKDKTVRVMSYENCRTIDYTVESQQGNEEAFFFWFALQNTFEFECQGYHPKTPVNDKMSESDQPKVIISKYWENTQRWGDDFRYIPRDKSN